ncbi:MAG TPA: DinB family protein [Candidatus Binatia bacterium]|nr:DinB family protein [Candidatus Binatia bacterium]
MSINELLLNELDAEVKATRTMLERVPFDRTGFAPHSKSMPLEKLAPHVAELPGFGLTILTTPALDFGSAPSRPRPPFEKDGMLKFFDEVAAKVRSALSSLPESAWTENWKLSFQGKPIFAGSRFLAYRQMFLNHLVHHRAQLGVYLRLTDTPVPATYGPSADDRLGL